MPPKAKRSSMRPPDLVDAAKPAKRKVDDFKAPSPKRPKTTKSRAPSEIDFLGEGTLTPSAASIGNSSIVSIEDRSSISISAAAKAINFTPSEILDVFVFGDGSSGQLGLGEKTHVKRPRLNRLLDSREIGVVQIGVGIAHAVALTSDSKLLTWGINDQGALGRETEWEGAFDDFLDDESDSGYESEINPFESVPAPVSGTENLKITHVCAGDSTTFAVTEEGFVVGWGTFRSNEGILGFSSTSKIQFEPTLIKDLKKIKTLAAGANHVLSLDEKGAVLAWGSGQQNQLGRRVVERNALHGLTPQPCGLPKGKIRAIACGWYHSLAIDNQGRVYCWGANSFGECGLSPLTDEEATVVLKPTVVEALADKNIVQVAGGEHHSVALAENGDVFVWGRLDGFQCGLKLSELPDDGVIRDSHGKPCMLFSPTKVPGLPKIKTVSCGSDHTIAISASSSSSSTDKKDGKEVEGQAYSWGFSLNYQTGHGRDLNGDVDVETPRLIDNTAVRGRVLNWAGCGGRFTVMTSVAASTSI